jgi:hypothetical protein
MSAISTTGARIVRLDNVRPAHRRHVRLIEVLKLERSSQYLCLEASITFISRPHDVPDRFFAPYSGLSGQVGQARHQGCDVRMSTFRV